MTKIKSVLQFIRKPALRQGFVVLVDQGFLSVATFLTGILVARSTDKAEYGLYVLGWTLVQTCQGLQRAIVSAPMTIYFPRFNAYDRHYYLGSVAVHNLFVMSLFAVLSFLVLTDTVTSGIGEYSSIEHLILPTTSLVLAVVGRDFLRSVLLAQMNVYSSVLVNALATLAQLGALYYLFTIKDVSVAKVYFVISAATACAALMMLVSQVSTFRVKFRRLYSDFKQNWAIGKWMLLELVAHTGASQSIPWLLLYFSDSSSVAVFGACQAIAGVMAPFLRGASSYIQPRLAHGYKDNSRANLLRLTRLSVFVMAVPFTLWFCIGSVFRNELILFFYSEAYSGYGLLLILCLGRTVLESVSTPLCQSLQTSGRADIVTKSLFIGMAFTLVAGPEVVSRYGVQGAGILGLLSCTIVLAFRTVWFFRIESVSSILTGNS